MSTLIAIAYPDADTAERVRAELVQATKEHLVQLQDAVVVVHQPDGKIKLHQAVSTTGAGAAGGVSPISQTSDRYASAARCSPRVMPGPGSPADPTRGRTPQ